MAKKKTTKKPTKAATKSKAPAVDVRRTGMVMRRADLGAEVGVFFATLDGCTGGSRRNCMRWW